ncbi:hypothetical protein AB2L57_09520 [Microbacterium sp. HA-8]|uniref:hypothetical protein n=1 Tax=Microbacterium sp. HA-8 TaxID=3234200 RepID=UPI0038F80BA1
MAVAALATTLFVGWTPLTMFVYGLLEPWWVWIYVGVLAFAAILFRIRRTALWAVLLEWMLFYGVIGLPTLIWASYPGLGGGVQELAFWIVLFGVAVALVARALGLGRVDDVGLGATTPAALTGYVVGAIAFTIYHVAVRHPVPGDWWTAPLCSSLAVVIALVFLGRSKTNG